MMTKRQLWSRLFLATSAIYEDNEAKAICRAIVEDIFGVQYLEILTEPDKDSGVEASKVDKIIAQVESHMPIQQIIGHTEFCGLRFSTPPGVLIPRPETEELVELIVSRHKGTSPRILDIGTGSGCIAVSLAKKLPKAQVCAVDISEQALRVAAANAVSCGVVVSFLRCDILAGAAGGKYDIIVSNPPYVTDSERIHMSDNVLEYEPAIALFISDSDPLLFYRTIAQRGREMLNPDGVVYFEINERFGPETSLLMQSEGYADVVVEKDIFGRERMVFGRLK